MKRLIWILSAGSLAGAVAVFLSILGDFSDIEAYKHVAPRHSNTDHRPFEFPTADSYSVIWKGQETPADPNPIPTHEIPEQFVLRSVFLIRSGNSVRGLAAIERGGEEHLYSEGAVLAGGYKLLAVMAGGAVLEKDGKRHTLLLKSSPKSFSEPVSIAAPKVTIANITEPKIDDVDPIKFTDPSGMLADKITITPEVWNYAVNNLHKILRNVRVRTDLSSGDEMSGLWIDPHRNSIPYKLGFRIGDIIRSVDGKPMKSVKDVMDFYQDALKARPKSVRVVFERHKKLRIREIQIRKPSS